MADLLIRGLSEQTMSHLKARAKRNGRSVQGEVKALIEANAGYTMAEAAAEAARIRAELAATGKVFGDSAEIIRADREDPDR
jgi:plasmid stability protein